MTRASEIITQSYLNGAAGLGQLPAPFENRFDEVNAQLADIVINGNNFSRLAPEVDDTGKLQRAIDFTGSQGLTLKIPAGTYTYSNRLNITYDGLKIIGEIGKTILKYTGSDSRSISFDKGGIIGTTTYGESFSRLLIYGIIFEAGFEQPFDGFGRPTSWYPATCLYLNGARNLSEIIGCEFIGYQRAIHSVFNWLCNYRRNWFRNCKEGMFLEDQCNNVSIADNIFRRCGDIADLSGYACKVKGSYSIVSINNDIEVCNSSGFIYENTHAFVHIGGDIENNDRSARKITVVGRTAADLNDREMWSYGGSISGVRFRNTLGIEFLNGSRDVNVTGCTFSESGTKNNAFTIRESGASVENIEIGVNDYYGDNSTYSHAVPLAMLATDEKSKLINRYFSLESPDIDVTNANGVPIGYFPNKVKINRIQIVVYQSTASGSGNLDIGVGANIGAIVDTTAFTGGDSVYSSPYGIYEVPVYTSVQNSGVVRARFKNNTMANGKIRVRIYYEVTG